MAFFKAMTHLLLANVLTVTFGYCFAKISQKEQRGEEEGKLTYIWLSSLSSCSCSMVSMSGELGP